MLAPSTFSRPLVHVLLLGAGEVGARVAASLLDRPDVRLIGMIARGRGAFDERGLPRWLVADLVRSRSRRDVSETMMSDRLELHARPTMLGVLARASCPVVIDCTTADGMDELVDELVTRGCRFFSARLAPPLIELDRDVAASRIAAFLVSEVTALAARSAWVGQKFEAADVSGQKMPRQRHYPA